MENFRTRLSCEARALLEHHTPLLTLGSCFSDSLGARLQAYKWPVLVNPFGTQFHPLALIELLRLALRGEDLPVNLYLEDEGASYHYYFPRTFFARDRATLAAQFTELAQRVRAQLNRADSCLILTLGTAFVYERDGQWVSNCHQQDARLFQKRLLTLSEMDRAWRDLLPLLPAHLRIILTLSPVRHLRDTLPLNSVSKSLLRVFIHGICEQEPQRLAYFPAYELLLDDLRDYRFYADDMLHPSEQALGYIWRSFCQAMLSRSAQSFVQAWTEILQRLQHRPLRKDTAASQAFYVSLLRDLEGFAQLDIGAELSALRLSFQEAEHGAATGSRV